MKIRPSTKKFIIRYATLTASIGILTTLLFDQTHHITAKDLLQILGFSLFLSAVLSFVRLDK